MVRKLKEPPTLRCSACGTEVTLNIYSQPTGAREAVGYWSAPCPCGRFQLFAKDDEDELARLKRVERKREERKVREEEEREKREQEEKEKDAKEEKEREELIISKLKELGKEAWNKIPTHWGLGRLAHEDEKTLTRLVREGKVFQWRKTHRHVWRYSLLPHPSQ